MYLYLSFYYYYYSVLPMKLQRMSEKRDTKSVTHVIGK